MGPRGRGKARKIEGLRWHALRLVHIQRGDVCLVGAFGAQSAQQAAGLSLEASGSSWGLIWECVYVGW